MESPTEYPKVMYRKGEVRVVDSADQQAAVEAEGWHASVHASEPEEPKEEPKRRRAKEE